MKTLSLRTTIAADGTINLHLPSGLPPGEAEVVIVVQPATAAVLTRAEPPYPSDYGVWRDLLPDIDVDAELREMNQRWEQRMDLPK